MAQLYENDGVIRFVVGDQTFAARNATPAKCGFYDRAIQLPWPHEYSDTLQLPPGIKVVETNLRGRLHGEAVQGFEGKFSDLKDLLIPDYDSESSDNNVTPLFQLDLTELPYAYVKVEIRGKRIDDDFAGDPNLYKKWMLFYSWGQVIVTNNIFPFPSLTCCPTPNYEYELYVPQDTDDAFAALTRAPTLNNKLYETLLKPSVEIYPKIEERFPLEGNEDRLKELIVLLSIKD